MAAHPEPGPESGAVPNPGARAEERAGAGQTAPRSPTTGGGLDGAAFDVANAAAALAAVPDATASFARTHAALKSALYYNQQLAYERSRQPAALRRSDSAESGWSEIRKTKSMGQLGARQSGASSPLTLSTAPHSPTRPNANVASPSSSTPTSGADSHPPSLSPSPLPPS